VNLTLDRGRKTMYLCFDVKGIQSCIDLDTNTKSSNLVLNFGALAELGLKVFPNFGFAYYFSTYSYVYMRSYIVERIITPCLARWQCSFMIPNSSFVACNVQSSWNGVLMTPDSS